MAMVARRNRSRFWVVAVAVVAVAGAPGCGRPVSDDLFVQAEQLVLERKFDEAAVLLRRYLCAHPNHSGAHYYLGRCYLASSDAFWMDLAEGEIETAHAIFVREGKRSTIERFPDVYFDLICQVDLVKIRVRQALFLIEMNAAPAAVTKVLAKAEKALEAARAVSPDAAEVKSAEKILQEFREVLAERAGGHSPPLTPRSPSPGTI